MSHYPTSAELASLRLAYRGSAVPYQSYRSADHVSPLGGALPAERVHGIGFRRVGDGGHLNGEVYIFPWNREARRVAIVTEARREASRMRSRAYYRLSHDPTTEPALPVLDLLHPDGAYFGPWYEETSYGAPYTWNVCECCGNPHTYCDCYGIAV